MSIRPITLEGDPYGIGLGLGSAVAPFVHSRLVRLPEWRTLQRWRGSERVAAMEALVRERFPGYVRELEGLADGAGLEFGETFVWNCRRDLAAHAREGCTTVVVPGERTHLIAHNEDGHPEFRGHCLLATIRQERAQAVVAFVYPASLPGNAFGANEAGLVQTVNNVRTADVRAGIPRQFLARAVLDAAGTDDAIGLLEGCQRASGYHHVLAQAGDPRVLTVEAPASGVAVSAVRGPFGHTNHLLSERLAHVPQTVTASSAARQARVQALCTALPGTPDAEAVRAVLADRDGALPIYRTDPDDPDEENTLATAIFRVGPDEVEWAVFDRADGPAVFRARGTRPFATGELD